MTKNVTLVVGGQAGSEGKGKICGYLAPEFDISVRVGGPNAGHTVVVGGVEYKFRQIPVASAVNPDCVLCIGAGGLINLDVLKEEVGWIPNISGRLLIDRNAGIVEKQDQEVEGTAGLFEAIGSTTKGVGASLARKLRRQNYRTAKDVPELAPYIANVQQYLFNSVDKQILVEGTQGYELSLNHGPYPFCTSRDVLAASLLSDCGLSPLCVKDIFMVIRTYPIRVFGNSGPMFGEITWEEVTKASGSPAPLVERTTVTNRVRRVGKFDWPLLAKAALANSPTQIALMFADYLDYKQNYGINDYDKLSDATMEFIEEVEAVTNAPVTIVSTGPKLEQTINRRV